jgi:hypothetical protein
LPPYIKSLEVFREGLIELSIHKANSAARLLCCQRVSAIHRRSVGFIHKAARPFPEPMAFISSMGKKLI